MLPEILETIERLAAEYELATLGESSNLDLLMRVRALLAEYGASLPRAHGALYAILERVEEVGDGAGHELEIVGRAPLFESIGALRLVSHWEQLALLPITSTILLPTESNVIDVSLAEDETTIELSVDLSAPDSVRSVGNIAIFCTVDRDSNNAWRDFQLLLDGIDLTEAVELAQQYPGEFPFSDSICSIPSSMWTREEDQLVLRVAGEGCLSKSVVDGLNGKLKVNCVPFVCGVIYAQDLKRAGERFGPFTLDDPERSARAVFPYLIRVGSRLAPRWDQVDMQISHDGGGFSLTAAVNQIEPTQLSYLLFPAPPEKSCAGRMTLENDWRFVTTIQPAKFLGINRFSTAAGLKRFLQETLGHRLKDREMKIELGHTYVPVEDAVLATAVEIAVDATIPDCILLGVEKRLSLCGPVGLLYKVRSSTIEA